MLTNKLTTIVVTLSTIASLTLGSVGAAFADTHIEGVGNGAFSTNQATVTSTNTNTAEQNNTATISNNVNTNSSTGGNTADFNTGGNTSITAGPATNMTQIENFANSNQLTANPESANTNGSTFVGFGSNGAFSGNTANVSSANTNQLFQDNTATANNNVTASANTGDNSTSFGTGGSTQILAGQAVNSTGILNALNQNVANVSGSANTGMGGTNGQLIGNGAYSDNNINVTNSNANVAEQQNSAAIWNDVTSNASGGNNKANFTTGGQTFIGVQGAMNSTQVENLANSNALTGFTNFGGGDTALLTQDSNGAYSSNGITANSSNANSLFQTNNAAVNNNVNSTGENGNNSASFGTGSVFGGGNSSILEGTTQTQTSVATAVNQNEIGSMSVGGWNLQFNWNPFSL